MAPGIHRQKLLNAVLYFVRNTRHVNLTKLLKLLYFLDFTHFKQTGYPCIGLRYYTFPKGPVPRDFWSEIRDGNLPEDFVGKLVAIPMRDEIAPTYKELQFRAKANPDLSVFTPREKRILEQLAFVFKDARAWEMSEITHLPKQPWEITIKQKGSNQLIDYLLAIDDEASVSAEDASESLKEYFEAVRNFHLEPA